MRTFTSADGSKTLRAKLVGCDPAAGTATIVREDGRRMAINLSVFSEADRAYARDWYQTSMAGRRLALRLTPNEAMVGERKTNNARIRDYAAGFDIALRNNGAASLDDIEVRYRVFYYRDGERGVKRQHLTADGTTRVSTIAARTDQSIRTDPVTLFNQRPLPPSQCTGGT